MTQWYYGVGEIWSFEASVATTSGVVVYIQGGKVRPTTAASQHCIGVSLVPASAGEQCSVIMEGIVKIPTTGVGSVTAGDLFGAGAGGKAAERAWSQLNERNLDLGFALESVARNANCKIKLTL